MFAGVAQDEGGLGVGLSCAASFRGDAFGGDVFVDVFCGLWRCVLWR